MTDTSNDIEFKQTLQGLAPARQRAVAARFVQRVLSLCDDARVSRAVDVAANPAASADEIKSAFHDARAAAVESHNRCGAECNWSDQAGYFVARAAAAAVSPLDQVTGGPAWQAAISSRMAQTCKSIESPGVAAEDESAVQYNILAEAMRSGETAS